MPNIATAFIHALPDELQIKILGELSVQDLLKSTVVCHKWKKLAYDGSLWSTINVTPFYKTIPIENILKLIKFSSRFLKTANFRGCIQLTGHALRTLSENCPNLEILIIKDCRGLSAASIGIFLQKSSNQQQLRLLDVSGLDTVKSSTLLAISPLLNKLEKLNMSWCKNITGSAIISMITTSSISLSYLKLNGCPQVDDSTMSCLGTYLPNLSHLCLAACFSLTDSGILAFLKYHPSSPKSKLTHLNLSNCARLTDATLRNLAIYSPNLTHLELAGCVLMTDQGFCFLSPRLRSLIHLDLEDLQQITAMTVQSIANSQPDLKRFCLSNCTQISDDAITHLLLHGICHKLQHLELDNCTITDKSLDTIAIYLQHQQKRRLSDITTDSSISLFSSSKSEQQEPQKKRQDRRLSVEVLDCSNITENGVRGALAKASPMLTIKSFYSFQYEDNLHQRQVNNEESMHDNIYHHNRSSSNSIRNGSRRYNSIGERRRSRVDNCIIL